MSDTSANNKRIAKNTLFMYIRMFITMVVGLYTSRIVLQTLGVEDFGIYNIVGGVVVLFTFINSAMASGTQRHISYELGKRDPDVSKIYSVCLNIHIWISVVIFLLSETVGLWFLNTQLNIPEGRIEVANWVYQFSVLSCIASIVRVPDNASIIAYEKMSFFAYMGILEAFLKLVVVYFLIYSKTDKLLLYSALLFIVTVVINIFIFFYRKTYLSANQYTKVSDKKKYGELLSFSGWALFGSVANVGIQQGINIIINIFYGVALNAAVGIANQVNSHVTTFVGGFQQALNPQLTKSQANADKQRQFSLICKSARFSFLIMMILTYPILLNLDYILSLWLGEYPEHTVSICNIVIIGALIETLSGPLWVTMFATGRIKVYQIVVSIVLLLSIPLSYIGGLYGMSPETMFVIRNFLFIANFFIRIEFLRRVIEFAVLDFLKDVLGSVIAVSLLLVVPVYLLPTDLYTANDFLQLIYKFLLIVIYELIVIYFLGIRKTEREMILHVLLKKIRK